jgi:hypothetical protein
VAGGDEPLHGRRRGGRAQPHGLGERPRRQLARERDRPDDPQVGAVDPERFGHRGVDLVGGRPEVGRGLGDAVPDGRLLRHSK